MTRNPWPYAIIGWFVLFISAMAAWIAYAVSQDMDLVRQDYYEEEVRYQQQLDRLQRTQALRSQIAVRYDDAQQAITFALPAAHAVQQPTGRVELYRPSDARLDRTEPLALDADGSQRLDAKGLRPGLWKLRVYWTTAGDDYYLEQSVVVSGN